MFQQSMEILLDWMDKSESDPDLMECLEEYINKDKGSMCDITNRMYNNSQFTTAFLAGTTSWRVGYVGTSSHSKMTIYTRYAQG